MANSQVDPTITIDSDKWAVSLLVTTTFHLGHTLIAVEGMLQGVRKCVVAHFVPYSPPGVAKASKFQLMKGEVPGGGVAEGQVKIKNSPNRTATVRDKVGSEFSAKTWSLTRQRALPVLDRINIDSVRGTPGVQIPRYKFMMLGQLTEVSPDTINGLNCANWSQMMLREAGITDQGGLLIDFPRTQALPGSRSDWMAGFLIGIGAVAYVYNLISK